jgi:hypothetical protein
MFLKVSRTERKRGRGVELQVSQDFQFKAVLWNRNIRIQVFLTQKLLFSLWKYDPGCLYWIPELES